MKKQIIFFTLLFAGMFCNSSKIWAQKDDIPPPKDKVNIEDSLPRDTKETEGKKFKDTSRRAVYWCEYGDGAFTKDSNLTPRSNRYVYNTLMLTAILYDTTKDGLAKFVMLNYQNGTTPPTSDNDSPLTNNASLVAITPSILSVVPTDTMVFAVTYNVPASLPTDPVNTTYKLIFFYNSSVFDRLITNSIVNVGNDNFPSVRTTHLENIDFLTQPDATVLSNITDASDYNSYITFDVLHDGFAEKNIFITLRPGALAALGGTGTVKAVLIKVNGSSYTIVGNPASIALPIARAHDPNYITQEKHCILTSKDNTVIKYHIHFQNDGLGNADSVIVKVSLPDKMNFTDFQFGGASVGSNKNPTLKIEKDRNSDSIIFSFSRIILYGTQHNPNALSDPKTMGDITFTLKSNQNFADTIYARAAIYFHTTGGSWEEAVFTQPVMSYFTTKCCSCIKPTPCHCTKFLKLCWWWWIVIAVAVIIIFWLFTRKRRRRRRTNEYNHEYGLRS